MPILILLSILASVVHDLHLSKSILHYNDTNQSFEVSIHVFVDDLENAIALDGAPSLFLETSKEISDAEAYLVQYFTEKFRINVEGQPVELVYIGREPSSDLLAIWCYFEASDIPPHREFSVENKLLLELFEDQKNLINITGPGLQKYFLWDQKDYSTTIKT